MTTKPIFLRRLRPSSWLVPGWYRPRYRQGWRLGFFQGMEHGRRLWGVDDELKHLLEELSMQDREAALLAGSIAMRSHALAAMSGQTGRNPSSWAATGGGVTDDQRGRSLTRWKEALTALMRYSWIRPD